MTVRMNEEESREAIDDWRRTWERLKSETRAMSCEIYEGGKKVTQEELEQHNFNMGTVHGYKDSWKIIQALRSRLAAKDAEIEKLKEQYCGFAHQCNLRRST